MAQEGTTMKRRIHDGIAGALITAGVGLGVYAHPLWLVLPGVLGITLLQSGFTGFCPVYYVLDRVCPPELPPQAARSQVQ